MKVWARTKSGRCANGWNNSRGKLFHAVESNTDDDRSLCGTVPANYWSPSVGDRVTCPKCLSKLKGVDYVVRREESDDVNIHEDVEVTPKKSPASASSTQLLEIIYMALDKYVDEEIIDDDDETMVRRYMRKLERSLPGIDKSAARHRRIMREIAMHNAEADMSPGRPSWLS